MSRALRFAIALLIATSVGLTAACGDKESKVASEEAREGRDRELLQEGIRQLQDGRHTQSRLLLNTLVNTYPDSKFLPVCKLALADSYYREGSTSSMNQSEIEYRDWLTFFPKHELADDVMMKIAEVHMRQVQAPDRDTSHAKLAERQLMRLLEQYPNTDLKPRIEQQLWEIREVLGMHELKVARFYYKQRQAYKAAASRAKEIVEKYPQFSASDEALFLLGVSLFEQEDTEEAVKYFQRLAQFYPDSEFFNDTVGYLKRLDAEVPAPAAEAERPKPLGPEDGIMGKVYEAISRPRLSFIDKNGVLFKKDDTPEQALEKAMQFSPAATDRSAGTND